MTPDGLFLLGAMSVQEWLAGIDWRLEAVGLFGEALFFARLLVQWLHSEQEGKPVLPITYWYMSLLGAVLVLYYAILKQSPTVLLPQFIAIPMYARNLQLELRHRAREQWRIEQGFTKPDYPWPTLSVVIPAHNEEQTLAATIESLLAQEYPGPKPQIIVSLNGCTDNTRATIAEYPVEIVESERAGMSWGKNFGAQHATGGLLIFVDADTHLPLHGLRSIAELFHDCDKGVMTLGGRPDRGGPVVRLCFWIANWSTRSRQVHAPGGVMAMQRAVFEEVGGFDETLPQGTSTAFICAAKGKGARYLFLDHWCATTSIRRFEKTGVIPQMLEWRRNHSMIVERRHAEVARKPYDAIR